jgi:hypothetical protein
MPLFVFMYAATKSLPLHQFDERRRFFMMKNHANDSLRPGRHDASVKCNETRLMG